MLALSPILRCALPVHPHARALPLMSCVPPPRSPPCWEHADCGAPGPEAPTEGTPTPPRCPCYAPRTACPPTPNLQESRSRRGRACGDRLGRGASMDGCRPCEEGTPASVGQCSAALARPSTRLAQALHLATPATQQTTQHILKNRSRLANQHSPRPGLGLGHQQACC